MIKTVVIVDDLVGQRWPATFSVVYYSSCIYK